MEIEVKDKDGLVESLKTYVMDNFNEKTFLNEKTILFDSYTEKNGHFPAYQHRSKDTKFDLHVYLKEIKNVDVAIDHAKVENSNHF